MHHEIVGTEHQSQGKVLIGPVKIKIIRARRAKKAKKTKRKGRFLPCAVGTGRLSTDRSAPGTNSDC